MRDDTSGQDGGASETGDLARELRREAGAVAPGEPPVEAVVRRGRTLRFRRRVAISGAAVVAAALPVSVALLPPLGAGEAAPPAARDTASPERDAPGDGDGSDPTDAGREDDGEPDDGPPGDDRPGPGEAREVAPDERVELGHGVLLGLLPGDGPRYAVATEEEWEDAADAAARQPPETTTLSAELVPSEETTLVVGGWRVLDDAPEIRLSGPEGSVDTTTVTLADEDEWGVFWADLGPTEDQVTVEYRGADGDLLASLDIDGAPPA